MKRLAWILTPWAFCLGCSMFDSGLRTMVVEPLQYCSHADQHRAHLHHEKLAQEAWDVFCKYNQGHDFSGDYACGFVEGFADYLDAGGCGEPPPLPPRRYWDQRDCRQASLDWFAGFRTGAGMAQRSGLRQSVVVPAWTRVYGGGVLVYPTPSCPQPTPPLEPIPAPNPITDIVPDSRIDPLLATSFLNDMSGDCNESR